MVEFAALKNISVKPMLSKKEVKDIQSLSLKKHRDESQLFVAEGPKIVEELIQLAPFNVLGVYGLEEWTHANLKFSDVVTIETIAPELLEKLSHLKTPNKVLAVLQQFKTESPNIDSVALYLDTIQDPGNFGTIIRIADWFGIEHVVCSAGCADLYNPKVVQATMGSIARVKVFYDNDGSWINSQQLPVYGASLEGKSVYSHEKIEQGIIMIGNESKGISDELQKIITEKITIPGKGKAESLNAAVATGILLSHLLH
jgi:RNA methyltransferase, TrmH family